MMTERRKTQGKRRTKKKESIGGGRGKRKGGNRENRESKGKKEMEDTNPRQERGRSHHMCCAQMAMRDGVHISGGRKRALWGPYLWSMGLEEMDGQVRGSLVMGPGDGRPGGRGAPGA